jgi:hypothetical protein
MNLAKLADIDKEIEKYEDALESTKLSENQRDAIWKHIVRLEEQRDRLLGDEIGIHKMPWYDENY